MDHPMTWRPFSPSKLPNTFAATRMHEPWIGEYMSYLIC
jgi:hypothetical protein